MLNPRSNFEKYLSYDARRTTFDDPDSLALGSGGGGFIGCKTKDKRLKSR